jgi:RNA-directed DNA polymerase
MNRLCRDPGSRVAARSAVPVSRKAEHRALNELLPFALSTLTAGSPTDPTVIDHMLKILRYGRTKTPAVANYIVGRDEPDLVIKGFDKLLRSKAYLNGWQTWWLQESASKVAGFTAGKGASVRLKWISDAFTSSEHAPTLRAYSALALARHKAIPLEKALSAYDRSSAAVRPVLVAAIAILQPTKSVERSIIQDSRLHRIVFEWASQNA